MGQARIAHRFLVHLADRAPIPARQRCRDCAGSAGDFAAHVPGQAALDGGDRALAAARQLDQLDLAR